jgi:hypothetical protein
MLPLIHKAAVLILLVAIILMISLFGSRGGGGGGRPVAGRENGLCSIRQHEGGIVGQRHGLCFRDPRVVVRGRKWPPHNALDGVKERLSRPRLLLQGRRGTALGEPPVILQKPLYRLLNLSLLGAREKKPERGKEKWSRAAALLGSFCSESHHGYWRLAVRGCCGLRGGAVNHRDAQS